MAAIPPPPTVAPGPSPMTRPTVAVVVPTRDRPRLLVRCLKALAEQRHPPDEVVVVDDASRVDVTEVVARAVDGGDLPVRYVRRLRPGGPARARNDGWPRTTATHVAFTDDDCRPDPGWLAALVAHAAERRIVVGRVEPDPLDGPVRTPLDRTMRVDRDDGRYSTCNVMYPRTVLEDLGGFDGGFERYGEDTDLGRRARAAGVEAIFVPEALVFHAVHRLGLRHFVVDRARVGETARLRRRHPLPDVPLGREGIWVNRDHRNTALAVAGLAAVPLTPAGLAFVARWLEVALGERIVAWPMSKSSTTLAVLALGDLVELTVCSVGAVRHRTLLL